MVLLHCVDTAEIDRCLKKVTEGVETFDDIWGKVRRVFLNKEHQFELLRVHQLLRLNIPVIGTLGSECQPERKI